MAELKRALAHKGGSMSVRPAICRTRVPSTGILETLQQIRAKIAVGNRAGAGADAIVCLRDVMPEYFRTAQTPGRAFTVRPSPAAREVAATLRTLIDILDDAGAARFALRHVDFAIDVWKRDGV